MLLKTLQANPANVPPQLLGQLSMLTGVERSTVEELVYQIRTNAATLDRGGKAGCALCCHMGYTNHDCSPNAQAVMFTEATVLAQELRKQNPNVKWAQHVKAGYAAVKKNDQICNRSIHFFLC